MKLKSLLATASVAAIVLCAHSATAASYTSYTSVLSGGSLIDFEGKAEGTLIDTQYAGVTFSQTPSGRPQIDNYGWIFGYGASSGSGVLTGSTEGGNQFATIAGIKATFSSGHNGVELFFSDTAPLGNYPITIYGAGGSVLASFSVASGSILPPGYGGGTFPPPGTSPLPGIFVGYTSAANDIFGIGVGPSGASNDSFALDDLRFTTGGAIPEPTTWAMMVIGFGGVGAMIRRRQRTERSAFATA